MHFKKLEFNDIPKVADTLYQYAPNTANDYTVTGLFLWRDLLNAYVAYEEEGIYIYQVVDGWHLFYPPLCGDVARRDTEDHRLLHSSCPALRILSSDGGKYGLDREGRSFPLRLRRVRITMIICI